MGGVGTAENSAVLEGVDIGNEESATLINLLHYSL
jgi:hypothetical protein